jgi:glycosyltransferase involved in cell wall biosynthesis
VREEGLEKEVALPGFAENPYPFVKTRRCFCSLFRWEGLPTVLIEALALDRPVVATDCPSGPREILEDGRWGRVVPVGDDAALAEAILEALEAGRAPAGAPQRMVERFGLDAVVEQYLDVLGLK